VSEDHYQGKCKKNEGIRRNMNERNGTKRVMTMEGLEGGSVWQKSRREEEAQVKKCRNAEIQSVRQGMMTWTLGTLGGGGGRANLQANVSPNVKCTVHGRLVNVSQYGQAKVNHGQSNHGQYGPGQVHGSEWLPLIHLILLIEERGALKKI
jgi:hypothetical protein